MHARKAPTERKVSMVEDSEPLFPHVDTSITRHRTVQPAPSEKRPRTTSMAARKPQNRAVDGSVRWVKAGISSETFSFTLRVQRGAAGVGSRMVCFPFSALLLMSSGSWMQTQRSSQHRVTRGHQCTASLQPINAFLAKTLWPILNFRDAHSVLCPDSSMDECGGANCNNSLLAFNRSNVSLKACLYFCKKSLSFFIYYMATI